MCYTLIRFKCFQFFPICTSHVGNYHCTFAWKKRKKMKDLCCHLGFHRSVWVKQVTYMCSSSWKKKLKFLFYFPLAWCPSDICFFGLNGSTAEVRYIEKKSLLMYFRALPSHSIIIFFSQGDNRFWLTFIDFFMHVRA